MNFVCNPNELTCTWSRMRSFECHETGILSLWEMVLSLAFWLSRSQQDHCYKTWKKVNSHSHFSIKTNFDLDLISTKAYLKHKTWLISDVLKALRNQARLLKHLLELAKEGWLHISKLHRRITHLEHQGELKSRIYMMSQL